MLLLGDLIASAGAMFFAIYVWYQLSLSREVIRLIERGFNEERAQRVAQSLIEIKIPYWFYLLPLVWLLLMIDSYDLHTAANWKKTLRGIAVAPIVGLLGYSVIFTVNQDPTSLPRIGIGVFLFCASLLTRARSPMIRRPWSGIPCDMRPTTGSRWITMPTSAAHW
jgi:hypothetical protein